jgi:hypothetical protein
VGVRVSVTHLNRVRAALTRATRRGKNQPGAWQDGAGGLLLLAAAAGSNLLPTLRIWGCGYGSAGFPRRMPTRRGTGSSLSSASQAA